MSVDGWHGVWRRPLEPADAVTAVGDGQRSPLEPAAGDEPCGATISRVESTPSLSEWSSVSTLPEGDVQLQEMEDELWEQMSPRVYRNLDEIFAGEYEGMSYGDIKRLRPDEASRAMDKIGYRYPRGESYFDILSRLDPLVHSGVVP